MIVLPIGVDPVKPSFLTSGCSDKAWPIDDPGPGSILITPGGNPAFTTSSANFRAVSGVTYQIYMDICNTYVNQDITLAKDVPSTHLNFQIDRQL